MPVVVTTGAVSWNAFDTGAVASTQALGKLTAHTSLLHLQVRQRNARLGLAIDTLSGKAAVIDARLEVGGAQRLVGEQRPAFADVDVLLAVVRQLTLAALARRHIQARLGPESRRGHFAGGGQQVRVEVARDTARGAGVHPR